MYAKRTNKVTPFHVRANMNPIAMTLTKVEQVPIVIIYAKLAEDRSRSIDSACIGITCISIDLSIGYYNIACTAVQLVMTSLQQNAFKRCFTSIGMTYVCLYRSL